MLINRANLTAMFTGFKTIFNDAFGSAQSYYERVAMVIPSTTAQEVYAWLGKTTRFREWIGERVVQNLGTHDFTIKNRAFENTVAVDRDNIEDDTYGVYKPLIQQLGQDSKTHPDELVFPLLTGGFAAECYDGQPFFDADHPVLDADGNVQSVSNMQAGAGTPWFLLDTSRVGIKPLIFQKRRNYEFVAMDRPDDEAVFARKEYRYGVDARCNAGYGLWQLAFGSKDDLDAENYAAARAAMGSFKGDNGKPLGVMPNLLVVPPTLEAAARAVLTVPTLANGAANPWFNTAELLVVPWLA